MPKTTTHDFKGLTDWVEIFQAGVQTDSRGRTKEFTTNDLDQIIANHDAEHPAPHVITHKEMYSPFAYAQSDELKREGNSLFVKSKKIEPQFEKLVQDGRLYERSIRLRRADKGFKLAHIAWLGAEAPAIEGLAPVEFESAEDVFEFSTDTYTPSTLSRMMRRMRDFIIDKFDIEAADKVLPDYEIDSLSDHVNSLRDEDSDSTSPNFSKHNPDTGDSPMPDFTQAQMDDAVKKATAEGIDKGMKDANVEFEKEKKVTDNKLFEERNKRLTAEYQANINTLIDAGKLTPAQATGMSEFMLAISSDDESAAFEFSQGEGDKAETKKQSAIDWFHEFTKSLGKQIDLNESEDDAPADFGEDSKAIADAATEFQKSQSDKGITVSVTEAVAHVTKGAK